LYAPAPVAPRGVRARRFASYGLDLFFIGAPWAAVLGMAAAPAGGNAESGLAAFAGAVIFCSLASLGMVVVELVTFIGRGRTLGMAVTGLCAVKGVKWLSVLLDPALALLSLAVAYPVAFVLTGMDVVSDEVTTAAVPFVPLLGALFNLAFLLLPSRRTLTDLVTGVVVADDGPPAPSPPSPRGGAHAIDGLVVGACGAPVLLIAGGSQLVTAALASALCALLVGVVELVLWTRYGATLGMRAMGISSRPRP
jgi:hypothetical protein